MAHIVEEEDRISKLPVHIIHHHILPLIYIPKEQARICILSKTWNRIWRSRPNVIIIQSHHEKLINSLGVQSFVNFVDDTLHAYLEQNLNIQKLCLRNLDHPDLSALMDRWLNLVILLNVTSLDIHASLNYSIPDAIYAAKMLTELRLHGCNFAIDTSTSTNKLQQLISTCSLIRDLEVCDCKGIKNLQVSGLANLEILEVSRCQGLENLEIRAPNLRIFEYEGAHSKKRKTRCEVEPYPCTIDILDGYSTLKILILKATTMTDQQLSKFSALEELELKSCCQMKNIQIVSDKIKRFTLWQWTDLEQVSMQHTANLIKFDFVGCNMPFSTMDLSNLEEAELTFLAPPDSNSYIGDVDTSWYNNLQDLVQKFNYSKGLILQIQYEQSYLIYEDPREILVPPTRELRLSIMNPSMHLESFVDDLISGHPNVISIVPRISSKMVQVMHERIPRYKKKQYRRLDEVINRKGATDQDGRTSPLYSWLKSTSLIERITTYQKQRKPKGESNCKQQENYTV